MINFLIGFVVGFGICFLIAMCAYWEVTSGHGDDIDRGIYGD